MKTFLVGAVAGVAIGAAVTAVVANSGAHHAVHYYDKPPEMSATAGLTPLTAEQAKAVLAKPAPVKAAAPAPVAAAPAAKPAAAAPAAAPAPKLAAPAQTAAAPAAAPAVAAPPAAAPPAAAAAAPAADLMVAGERAFNKCKACHSLAANGRDGVGPNMHGLFGRKSGTKAGFKFSEAMTKAGIVWDEATIDQYLSDPKGFIPQNRMAFPGVPKKEERDAIIAYLKQATK